MRKYSKQNNRVRSFVLLCLIAVLCATLISCGKDEEAGNVTNPEPVYTDAAVMDPDTGDAGSADARDGVLLRDFCQDEELNAWFNSLPSDVPVEMDFWIYGEGPVGMTFSDPALILQTAAAIQSVRIGGPSKENPENTADAWGEGFYFTMADGSQKQFSFMMGTFSWKDSGYHDLISYGDLSAAAEKLSGIGNPQYMYAYSEDRGFYTKHLETYNTGWNDESAFPGGLLIYTEVPGLIPFVSIARCDTNETDPEKYIKEKYKEDLTKKLEAAGMRVKNVSDVEEYTFEGQTLSGILFTAAENGGTYELLALIMKAKDSLPGEDHLVSFSAMYPAGRDNTLVMQALKDSIRYFELKNY